MIKARASAMEYASEVTNTGMISLQGLTFEQAGGLCETMNLVKNDVNHQISVAIKQYPKSVAIGGSWEILNKVINREHSLVRKWNN